MKIDPIQSMQFVAVDGGFVLRVTRMSCKKGYVSETGIVSNIDQATVIGLSNGQGNNNQFPYTLPLTL